MDGKILQIPRERDKPFLYMPNPSVIHPRSIKIDHHLKIVDLYIHARCPQTFIPEPDFKDYFPDAYMINHKGEPMCVEVQLTPISSKKMQKKVDEFVSTHDKEHDARTMLLVTNNLYDKVTIPPSFNLRRIPLPDEPYTQKTAT